MSRVLARALGIVCTRPFLSVPLGLKATTATIKDRSFFGTLTGIVNILDESKLEILYVFVEVFDWTTPLNHVNVGIVEEA